MKNISPLPNIKFDWPFIMLLSLTVLGVMIVFGMLIGIPLWFFF